MLQIMDTTFDTVSGQPTFDALLSEYADECRLKDLPEPACQRDVYRAMEKAGIMCTMAAFNDKALIGFSTILISVLPHYGVLMATTESLFVHPDHRSSGAGLQLIHRAENLAIDRGAAGLLVTAPVGGTLSKVLPRLGYTDTNTVFFRRLTNE
jgi:GNAT superfamily N-acetyltransferase